MTSFLESALVINLKENSLKFTQSALQCLSKLGTIGLSTNGNFQIVAAPIVPQHTFPILSAKHTVVALTTSTPTTATVTAEKWGLPLKKS